jgi:hypothetical protein
MQKSKHVASIGVIINYHCLYHLFDQVGLAGPWGWWIIGVWGWCCKPVICKVMGYIAVFCRAETETYRFIRPHEFMGFSHEIGKAYTLGQVDVSAENCRITTYCLGGLIL